MEDPILDNVSQWIDLTGNGHNFEQTSDSLKPEFMTFALPVKEKTYSSLAGAMHPVDKTCRPQVLKEKTNPKLHQMLRSYCDTYDQFGVLQTSFNIHGEPIVNSAEDAFSTLDRSGLRHLLLEDFLVTKK